MAQLFVHLGLGERMVSGSRRAVGRKAKLSSRSLTSCILLHSESQNGHAGPTPLAHCKGAPSVNMCIGCSVLTGNTWVSSEGQLASDVLCSLMREQLLQASSRCRLWAPWYVACSAPPLALKPATTCFIMLEFELWKLSACYPHLRSHGMSSYPLCRAEQTARCRQREDPGP